MGSFTQTLGRALAARGHRITAVGIYPIRRVIEEKDQGVQVIRLPHAFLPRTGFLINGDRLRKALSQIHRQSPIDIIDGPELSLAFLPKRFPVLKIIRMNGGHHFFSVTLGKRPDFWKSWKEKRSFRRADFFCAVSRFIAQKTQSLLPLERLPVEILYNPVDTQFFSPRSREKEDDGLILFVGTVCEKKGIRQLIQAMPQIISKVPQARLRVVGRDWKDPRTGESYIRYLQGSIPESLRSQIFFEGPIEHSMLPDIISKAAVCVYPSHIEAFGIACLEGMAAGKAVVTSNTGPGPEVLQDEISGLFCNPFDPRSIAGKVISLLTDPGLRRRLGEQARLRALNLFSIDALAERNEIFYQRCLEEHSRG